MPKKEHFVSKRIDKRSGSRTDYTILLNGQELSGYVVRAFAKGKEIYKTIYNGIVHPTYDPQWLAHKNGRRIKLDNHPCMATANAYYTLNPDKNPWLKEKKPPSAMLRKACKDLGLKGYAKATYADLEAMLQQVALPKQDVINEIKVLQDQNDFDLAS